VADYLRDYASELDLPVHTGMPVSRLARVGDRFVVETPAETLEAAQVVVATGAFQVPFVPALASALDPGVVQLHSSDYRNPSQLPDGPVLVVGGGNSGLQIALELAAERPVTVAVGERARMVPQTVLGKDVFWWLTRAGLITRSADSRLGRRMRATGELVIGTRAADLSARGVAFCGRVTSTMGRHVGTADGGELTPASVVWATGFRCDWSWVDVPDAVVDGQVVHRRGVTPVPGLCFLGLPWQHSRGSALLGFVGDDAAFISEHLRSRTRATVA
jgi:putative flavoprotein involved in K+ transport